MAGPGEEDHLAAGGEMVAENGFVETGNGRHGFWMMVASGMSMEQSMGKERQKGKKIMTGMLEWL